jgi:hypothetical protein
MLSGPEVQESVTESFNVVAPVVAIERDELVEILLVKLKEAAVAEKEPILVIGISKLIAPVPAFNDMLVVDPVFATPPVEISMGPFSVIIVKLPAIGVVELLVILNKNPRFPTETASTKCTCE